jgi:hypothetical protein
MARAGLACLLRWGLENFFPRLALNLNPLNLDLLSIWNYSHELPHLAAYLFFLNLYYFQLNFAHSFITHSFMN